MIEPVFNRQSRTPSSEQYQIMVEGERLGHIDLHFGATEVFATLVLDRELSEDEVEQIIDRIDEDLVLSAEVPREDFLIRVYIGRELGLGLYSDEIRQDEYVLDGHEEGDE